MHKGMYGLKLARSVAFNYIVENLSPFRYHLVNYILGLWICNSRPTTFTLFVDNFCIKYYTKDIINHLMNALTSKNEISTNYSGAQHIGITLDWGYDIQCAVASTLWYINKLVHVLCTRRAYKYLNVL